MSAPSTSPYHPLQARLALRRHLLHPDGSALLGDAGEVPGALALAAALATSLLGGVAFFGAASLGSVGATGSPLDALSAGVVGALAAGVLTLPPLFVANALGRREGGVQEVLASASVGPAVAGAWLLASTPLLALYGSTASEGRLWGLLVLGLAGLALVNGMLAAVSRARRAGLRSPGAPAVAAHYLLTAWTALVLALHLA
jgi:hypothetical protein